METHHLNVEWPAELQPFKHNIESTIKPYIEIKARIADKLLPWQSKFGGLPYLPKGTAYPRNLNGRPLWLLAQLNLAEMPGLDGFPPAGMLEFYISDDDLYGMHFEDLTKPDGFRILYFPDVYEDAGRLITDFDFLPKSIILPFERSCALTFGLRTAPISVNDEEFGQKILGKDLPEWSEEMLKLWGPYEKLFPALGHRLGGYPYFTQSDPRGRDKYRNANYVLLFQMDSDDPAGIMWGDAGVGNFFIREQDLQKRDFSHVLYTWDCC